jgi:uncharacterized membrane protein
MQIESHAHVSTLDPDGIPHHVVALTLVTTIAFAIALLMALASGTAGAIVLVALGLAIPVFSISLAWLAYRARTETRRD